jgi:hypothetical protein
MKNRFLSARSGEGSRVARLNFGKNEGCEKYLIAVTFALTVLAITALVDDKEALINKGKSLINRLLQRCRVSS